MSFSKDPTNSGRELDPFFVQTFVNPAVTIAYLGKTYFYSTTVTPSRVLDTSHEFEWRYKDSVIKNGEDTFANYCEYVFTTSQAMRYEAYFHPSYSVE